MHSLRDPVEPVARSELGGAGQGVVVLVMEGLGGGHNVFAVGKVTGRPVRTGGRGENRNDEFGGFGGWGCWRRAARQPTGAQVKSFHDGCKKKKKKGTHKEQLLAIADVLQNWEGGQTVGLARSAYRRV